MIRLPKTYGYEARMKAMVYTRYGSPSVLRLEEVPAIHYRYREDGFAVERVSRRPAMGFAGAVYG